MIAETGFDEAQVSALVALGDLTQHSQAAGYFEPREVIAFTARKGMREVEIVGRWGRGIRFKAGIRRMENVELLPKALHPVATRFGNLLLWHGSRDEGWFDFRVEEPRSDEYDSFHPPEESFEVIEKRKVYPGDKDYPPS